MLLDSAPFFQAPAALSPSASPPDALAGIQAARRALDALERQALALDLADFFKRRPDLLAFDFTIIDPRNRYERSSVRVNGESQSHFSEPSTRAPFNPLAGSLAAWIDARLSQPFVRSWSKRRFERPESPEALHEGVLAQCLSPDDFAQWQAALLAQAAGPAGRGAPKAL